MFYASEVLWCETTEGWTSVPGYDLYEVTELGGFAIKHHLEGQTRGKKTRDKFRKQKIIIPDYPAKVNSVRYINVSMTNNDGSKNFHLAAIILMTFVGPRPPDMYACHNNGIKGDNRLLNLRWDTQVENMKDKYWHANNPGTPRDSTPPSPPPPPPANQV